MHRILHCLQKVFGNLPVFRDMLIRTIGMFGRYGQKWVLLPVLTVSVSPRMTIVLCGSTVDAIQNFAKQYSYTVNIIKQTYEKNGCKFTLSVFCLQGQPLVLGWPYRLIFS
ncbi:hypothetical protein [Treponema denticola]|uniref:hypothetical protein n=1 Tax=Treponema denticola TaxID=158 RepID=UPI0012BAA766|nr:hypothetical protein [Treponema denticola]